MSWVKLDAQWNGTCSTCSVHFPRGTSIFWENNTKKTKHEECDIKQDSTYSKNTDTLESLEICLPEHTSNKKEIPITCGNYYTTKDTTKNESRIDDLSKIILENKLQNQHRCDVAAQTLSEIMFKKITQYRPDLLTQIDMIVPVPTDRWVPSFSRGVSIGYALASLMKKPFEKDILNKTKSINRKGLGIDDRREIANKSYEISNEIHLDNTIIKNKNILLVDDVLVGGSTTEKCTRLLIENGARQVQVICATQSKFYR